jgi:hypothetical protein
VTTAHPVERHAEGDEFTYLRRRSLKMAISDELTKLAARASEAEKRGAEAREKARADLEQDVSTARATAQAGAERFRERGVSRARGGNRAEISAWWADVQKAWNERVAAAREDIEAKKEEHDVRRAQPKAEHAESDARYWIDFAYTAIEEAEYAALYAVARRTDADELSAGHPAA